MRIPSPKLAILAIAVCIGLIQQIDADAQAKHGMKVHDQKHHPHLTVNHQHNQQQQDEQHAAKDKGFEA